MRTYQTEFPDFTLDVEIPKDFDDQSWHNDTAPSWFNNDELLLLYIDYADAELREFTQSKRFLIAKVDNVDDQAWTDDWVETDDYQQILNFIEAH